MEACPWRWELESNRPRHGGICGSCTEIPPRAIKLFSWNFYGLENLCGIQSLCELVKQKDLDLIFLQETNVLSSYFSSRKFSLGFQNILAVDCEGKSGGLVFLWKEKIQFEVLRYSFNFIYGILIVSNGNGQKCLLIGFYGFPKAFCRSSFWDNLKGLRPEDETPWMVFGDFNEILIHSEK